MTFFGSNNSSIDSKKEREAFAAAASSQTPKTNKQLGSYCL